MVGFVTHELAYVISHLTTILNVFVLVKMSLQYASVIAAECVFYSLGVRMFYLDAMNAQCNASCFRVSTTRS